MSTIPEAAIEAAAKAMHRYDVSVGLATFVIPTRHHKEEARAAVEAAAPFLIQAELDSIIATFVPSAQTLLDTVGMLTASTAKRQAWADGAQFIANLVTARRGALEGK